MTNRETSSVNVLTTISDRSDRQGVRLRLLTGIMPRCIEEITPPGGRSH